METSLGIEVGVIVISIILSAFFSATETALTSLSPLKIRHIMEEKGEAANSLSLWLHHPGNVLNTILFANNLVNILASVLAARIMEQIFVSASIGLTTGVMTFLILIFGEITPKTFAKNNAQTVAIFNMKILKIFYYVSYPITFIMSFFVSLILKITGGSADNNSKMTEDELEFLISVGEKEGVLGVSKGEMLGNIFDISDMHVKEVMVPRIDIKALNEKSTKEEFLELFKKTEFSRIPVYRESLDNIIGILYIKDVIKLFDTVFTMEDVLGFIREPLFSPETKNIDVMLKEFQKNRSHLAVVIDEYGGTAGIVTMEDILEEIVGDIIDEFDEVDDEITKVNDNMFLVDARMDLDDFCEEFVLKKTEEMSEYETLGGFVYDTFGEIPNVGDDFEWDGYKFTVRTMQDRKLGKIEILKITVEADETDESKRK